MDEKLKFYGSGSKLIQQKLLQNEKLFFGLLLAKALI